MSRLGEQTSEFKSHNDSPILSISNLATTPRWVAWREETVTNQDGTTNKTKIPYNPHNGQKARVPTDPSTWGTRKQAERRWTKLDDGRHGGIGIALGDLDGEWTLMGIDLDRCLTNNDGIHSWANEVIERFNTYSEVSPSQRGVKLFFLIRAKDRAAVQALLGFNADGKPKARKTFSAGDHREIAIDRDRFYAITEDRLHEDTPKTFRVISVDDVRWFIEQAGPAYLRRHQSNNNESRTKSTRDRDESGSGYGFRFLQDCKRRGLSYEQAREAILEDEDRAGEWARRKNERAVKLAWDNVREQPHSHAEDSECLLQSSGEFVRDFVPPDYLIDGLLQRRFSYSMTGATGSGKTSLCLRLAAHTALGLPLAGREIIKAKVLFLAGENPDDVRQRWIKLSEEMEFDPEEIDVAFLPKVVPLSNETIREQIETQTKERGPFGLVIVDTNIAYFEGDNENDNAQMASHARLLRSLIPLIDGGPTIITTCHPTKTPNMDNLLPRGGGAFLAEVDGNLVCMKQADSMVIELHWHGKFRGPDFAPSNFLLEKGTSDRLKDSKGRNIWTITAQPVSEEEHTALDDQARSEQDQVMAELLARAQASIAEIARALGWFYTTGDPDKSKVQRILQALIKDKLVEKNRGRYQLTNKGKKALKGTEQEDQWER